MPLNPSPLRLSNMTATPIASVDDWFRLAPPAQGLTHWKDGRSAKESARAWLRTGYPAVPAEMLVILDSHPLTRGFVGLHAIPEAVIRLDNLAGGQRNADMLLIGQAQGQRVVVTVEAKVDESFGELIGEYYDSYPPPRSKVQERIDGLAAAVFGRRLDAGLRGLRYQLLHGTAGTLVAAGEHQAEVAVFLAHVFETRLADQAKLARNRNDWDRFVEALAARVGGAHGDGGVGSAAGQGGRLLGPFSPPGRGRVPGGLRLLVGYCKAVDAQSAA